MKIIKFSVDAKSPIGNPVPIKNKIPEWYRLSESYYTDDDSVDENGNKTMSNGLKTCAPFLDALVSGYALVTPFDIFISQSEDGDLKIEWNGPSDWNGFINERSKNLGAKIPRPTGHLPNHLIWANKWGWKAPRGYSVLVTHPLNRFDLPFTTMSGIIDSDKFFANGNLPFFMKEGFSGMIPEGTPVAQLIPIKRNSWVMSNDQSIVDEYYRQGVAVRKKGSSYKNILWKRKEYK